MRKEFDSPWKERTTTMTARRTSLHYPVTSDHSSPSAKPVLDTAGLRRLPSAWSSIPQAVLWSLGPDRHKYWQVVPRRVEPWYQNLRQNDRTRIVLWDGRLILHP